MLRRKIKPIRRTFGVVAYIIYIDSIDLAYKKIKIEKMSVINAVSILSLEIK